MIKHARYVYRHMLAGFFLIALASWALISSPASAYIFGENKEPQTFTSLSGFQPNVTVSYQIHTAKRGLSHVGTAQTDEFGNLKLPMPNQLKGYEGKKTYNFVIDQKDQSLNIVLKHDPQNDSLHVTGSGTSEFTKIIIKNDLKALETKSDWSGFFEEEGIKDIWSPTSKGNYEIAFFNANPSEISDIKNPAIIEVAALPGGGGGGGGNALYANFIAPMQLAAQQLSFNAMYQAFVVGTFFDAKEQLETQRDLQILRAEAVRDYHPSEQMCRIGTFTRSLAPAEEKIETDSLAINKIMVDYYNNESGGASHKGDKTALEARLKQFKETFCNPADSDGNLTYLCKHDNGVGAADNQEMNRDIDFTRTLGNKYTLDVDYTNDTYSNTVDTDEVALAALAKNLYWPKNYPTENAQKLRDRGNSYISGRRILALSNIAHNSFARQVALKAKSPTPTATPADQTGWAHMKTMMREFGLDDEDIVDMIGENPSYYAQMDILTKKLYQHPNFYTNLYDKTANVDRIIAAMEAISLMQLRDQYDVALRKEMLTSGAVQVDLLPTIERVQAVLHEKQK